MGCRSEKRHLIRKAADIWNEILPWASTTKTASSGREVHLLMASEAQIVPKDLGYHGWTKILPIWTPTRFAYMPDRFWSSIWKLNTAIAIGGLSAKNCFWNGFRHLTKIFTFKITPKPLLQPPTRTLVGLDCALVNVNENEYLVYLIERINSANDELRTSVSIWDTQE